jgi:hypothetical protein
MVFNPLPMNYEDRKYQQLAHAEKMLNILGSLGAYSPDPLPKYNYGENTSKLNQQINSDFLDSLVNSQIDRIAPSLRRGALKRRYSKK